MKSVDPGIFQRSECFSFLPSEMAKEADLMYATWCGHYFCTNQYYMERDTYPNALLMFIRNGKMDIRYGGQSYQAKRGDIVLMDCVHPHYYRAHDGLEFLYLHYDGGATHYLTDYLIEMNGSPIFLMENNLEISKELYDFVQAHIRGTVFNPFHLSHWISGLLYKLSVAAIPPIKEDSPVDQAIKYIVENVGKQITLDDLARLTNFSPFYLSHTFKKQTGYSPSEYIINVRLDHAQVMLMHTRKTISEIADAVGYSSSSSFINVFTKKVGMTPKAYRTQQQKKSSGK